MQSQELAMPKQGELLKLAESLPPVTIARYRLTLVREAGTPYSASMGCSRPDDVARLLHTIVVDEPREVMGALFLNARNRAIGHTVAYTGTLRSAVTEPRGIFVPALLANAAALILFHNHPSGDPSPSREDYGVTRQMAEAGQILGVRVLDHIVLGEAPRYASLRELGGW
jgi:DNA repair protein RadC